MWTLFSLWSILGNKLNKNFVDVNIQLITILISYYHCFNFNSNIFLILTLTFLMLVLHRLNLWSGFMINF